MVGAVRATAEVETAEGEYGISCSPEREAHVLGHADGVHLEWPSYIYAGNMMGKFRVVVAEAQPLAMPGGHADHH